MLQKHIRTSTMLLIQTLIQTQTNEEPFIKIVLVLSAWDNEKYQRCDENNK